MQHSKTLPAHSVSITTCPKNEKGARMRNGIRGRDTLELKQETELPGELGKARVPGTICEVETN